MMTTIVGIAYASQEQGLLRNVTIGGVNVGRLNSVEALKAVDTSWASFAGSAFVFKLNSQTETVPVVSTSASEEEVIIDLATFDDEASVNAAYNFGHEGPWWTKTRERLSAWLGRTHEFGKFTLGEKSLTDVLQTQFESSNQPAVNAGLQITDAQDMTITPSATGNRVNISAAISQAKRQLRTFNAAPIAIHINVVQPEIAKTEALLSVATQQAPALLKKAPLTLTYADQKWTIDQAKLQNLLGFVRRGPDIAVGFDSAKTTDYLETLRKNIDVAPQNAKFSVADGRVKEFQASVVGITLDAAATISAMNAALSGGQNTVAMVVKESKPLTDTVNTNTLGIKELVAEARTNFKGSPPNRVYNLTYGAKLLNGLMIQPGETFSLVQALGHIDAKNGWKPELVIKGTKITPEFGGGLCQVATTMFRTALNAGLPIVERSNHSLRIHYYEPPVGLDATIYEPKPDLKFTNDYGHALLLQTRVEGTDLIFSFYGTKEGRVVDIPDPKVYNRTGIPPTITYEDDTLKPGEKQCQTPGHPGADATATYTVTKTDGTSVTQTFQSHYRPLPVICRVGKKK